VPDYVVTILLIVVLSLVLLPVARRFLRPRIHGLTVGPGAFELSLRVTEGSIPGLSSHWRHGVATVNSDELTWRRSPFSTTLALHIVSLDGTRMRPPHGIEWITRAIESVAIPARTADGTQIEIAVLRRDIQRFRDRLGASSV
jgi:hypothetical protein